MSTKRSLAALRLGIAFAVLCTLWGSAAPVAEAQVALYDDAEVIVVAPGDPATKAAWGTQDRVTYSVSGGGFQPDEPGKQVVLKPFVTTNDAKWYVDAPSLDSINWTSAPLTLPTGALVTAVEMAGCDHGNFGELFWGVRRASDSGELIQDNADSATGSSPDLSLEG